MIAINKFHSTDGIFDFVGHHFHSHNTHNTSSLNRSPLFLPIFFIAAVIVVFVVDVVVVAEGMIEIYKLGGLRVHWMWNIMWFDLVLIAIEGKFDQIMLTN